MYFWTYGLRKTWLGKCLKKPLSEETSKSDMVNGQKYCSKLDFDWFLSIQFSWKKSLLMICIILGLFVNPLTANDMYSLLTRGNLLLRFEMPFSQKPKIFPDFSFFFAVSQFRFNFEHFQKIDEPHRWCTFELTDSKICG